MTEDARFEDAGDLPLRLRAETAEDLAVISALVQDAVSRPADAIWMPKRRRFAALLNRFRWEDAAAAERQDRPVERVRSMLAAEGVLAVRATGVDPKERERPLVLLALEFVPGADGAGTLRLVLSGDGVIALDVEALELTLTDVTRPYVAPSGHTPTHPGD